MTEQDDANLAVLPERISGLGPLAENLWWSWNPDAESLYRDLDPLLFVFLEENPVLLLRRVAPERLTQAASDPAYLARYDAVMAQFGSLLTEDPASTWVENTTPS